MDLEQKFISLSIKDEGKLFFEIQVSEELKGPWVQLSMPKSARPAFAVGEYIEMTSAESCALFRIKSVGALANTKNIATISKSSSTLFCLSNCEKVSIQSTVPCEIVACEKIILSGFLPNRLSPESLMVEHGIFRPRQQLSSRLSIKASCSTDHMDSIVLVRPSTQFAYTSTAPSFMNTSEPGKLVWYLNVKVSDISRYHHDHTVICIFPEDDIYVIERDISEALTKNSSLIVLDISGRSQISTVSRVILKYGFIIVDTSVDAQNIYSPLAKTSDSWNKIGGYEHLVYEIKRHVEGLLQNKTLPVLKGPFWAPPRGILLYGPPGCSKTMIARAIAGSMSIEFLSVKGPEIFSKWVGDSEKAISEIFSKARKRAPCVIFFDEFDSLSSSRSSNNNSAVESRVVAQLLSEIDGISGGSRIIIIAATNRPDVIDPALLRPGRFDLHFHVSLPDPESRRKIIELNLSNSELLDDPNLMSKLVELSSNCSGAEVANGCRKLLIAKIKGINTHPLIDASLFSRTN